MPREITPRATHPHRLRRISRGETKEKRAFEDRHENTKAYIDYLRPRCVQLARVLKQTGSFYYHCDWHASHYVKVMLDQIFGENNLTNKITT
jgi:adenine specific DNA methylase Mod